MSPFTPEETARAMHKFNIVNDLDPKIHGLVVFGLGSGALVDLLLKQYAPQTNHQHGALYADHVTQPKMKLPIWVIDPDASHVEQLLKTVDWDEALHCEQLQIFCGDHALRDLLTTLREPSSAYATSRIISPDTRWEPAQIKQASDAIDGVLAEIKAKPNALINERLATLQHRFDLHSSDALQSYWETQLAKPALKILCIGTRFSTFVGKSMAGLARGFERLGHKIKLVQEESDTQRVRPDRLQSIINEFDPDLVVSINYTRHFFTQGGCCLDGIPFWCWFQDYPAIHELRNESAKSAHTPLDIYFTSMTDWSREVESLGYGSVETVHIPTDDSLYDLCEPTPDELKCFGCDVSCVSSIKLKPINPADQSPESRMELEAYQENVKRIHNGDPQLLLEDYERIILKYSNRNTVSDQIKVALRQKAIQLEEGPGRVAFRATPLVWLSQSGFDLTLYGGGWNQHPVLRKHHRGTIPYGEPLASMLRSSKIHICTHGTWSLTMKVLDCLAVGTLPMVHHVDPRRDHDPISKWFKEDEEIVIFRNRTELLDKVHYYLDHPDERQALALRGREIVLKQFTYLRLVEKILAVCKQRMVTE